MRLEDQGSRSRFEEGLCTAALGKYSHLLIENHGLSAMTPGYKRNQAIQGKCLKGHASLNRKSSLSPDEAPSNQLKRGFDSTKKANEGV